MHALECVQRIHLSARNIGVASAQSPITRPEASHSSRLILVHHDASWSILTHPDSSWSIPARVQVWRRHQRQPL